MVVSMNNVSSNNNNISASQEIILPLNSNDSLGPYFSMVPSDILKSIFSLFDNKDIKNLRLVNQAFNKDKALKRKVAFWSLEQITQKESEDVWYSMRTNSKTRRDTIEKMLMLDVIRDLKKGEIQEGLALALSIQAKDEDLNCYYGNTFYDLFGEIVKVLMEQDKLEELKRFIPQIFPKYRTTAIITTAQELIRYNRIDEAEQILRSFLEINEPESANQINKEFSDYALKNGLLDITEALILKGQFEKAEKIIDEIKCIIPGNLPSYGSSRQREMGIYKRMIMLSFCCSKNQGHNKTEYIKNSRDVAANYPEWMQGELFEQIAMQADDTSECSFLIKEANDLIQRKEIQQAKTILDKASNVVSEDIFIQSHQLLEIVKNIILIEDEKQWQKTRPLMEIEKQRREKEGLREANENTLRKTCCSYKDYADARQIAETIPDKAFKARALQLIAYAEREWTPVEYGWSS